MRKIRPLVRRWWPLLLLSGLLSGAAGALVGNGPVSAPAQTFQSDRIVISKGQSNLEQSALLITAGEIPLRATEALKKAGVASEPNISARAQQSTGTITVTATAGSAADAERITKAHVDEFLKSSQATGAGLEMDSVAKAQQRLAEARQNLDTYNLSNPKPCGSNLADATCFERRALENQVERAAVDLDELRNRLDATRADFSELSSKTSRVEGLVDSGLPSSPPVRAGLLGTLGLAGATLIALGFERINPRFDFSDELEQRFDLPVLGEIPAFSKSDLRSMDDLASVPFEGPWAESGRRLGSVIRYLATTPTPSPSVRDGIGPRPAVILICSAIPSEGKTTAVILASLALAESGIPTLAVGADFRRPTLDRRLGVPRYPGLRDLAALTTDRAHPSEICFETSTPGLWVAPSGIPGRSLPRLAPALAELLEDASKKAALALIDSAPLAVSGDVLSMVPLADHVVVIVRAGRAAARSLRRALDSLRAVEAPVAGFVLVGSSDSSSSIRSYYDYYGKDVG